MIMHTILRKYAVRSISLGHTDSVFAQNSMQHHLDVCATKVQHSPSATISVKPCTYSLTPTFDKSNVCSTQNAHQLHLQSKHGKRSIPLEINVLLVYQNAMTLIEALSVVYWSWYTGRIAHHLGQYCFIILVSATYVFNNLTNFLSNMPTQMLGQ